MMVSIVVNDEDSLAVLVVAGDEAPGMTQALTREFGEGTFVLLYVGGGLLNGTHVAIVLSSEHLMD